VKRVSKDRNGVNSMLIIVAVAAILVVGVGAYVITMDDDDKGRGPNGDLTESWEPDAIQELPDYREPESGDVREEHTES